MQYTQLDDTIRTSGPYEVVCKQCHKRLGYAAPHPFNDEILLGRKLVPPNNRTGGYTDIVDYQYSGQQPVGITLGYASDSEEWQKQSRRRFVASGEGRYTFNCNCGNAPTLKAPALIDLYLEAHDHPVHELAV